MAELLTLIAVLGFLVLAVIGVRRRHLHFRVADWPLARQLETALALAFALFGGLALIAGERWFAAWLLLMGLLMLTATLREYRR